MTTKRKVPQPKPVVPQDQPMWATECPTRSPKFKTYHNRGHALSAMADKVYGEITLYVLEGDQWVPKVHVPKVTHCDYCGEEKLPGYLMQANHHCRPAFITKMICMDCYRSGVRPNYTDPSYKEWVAGQVKDISEFLLDPTFEYYL